MSSLVIKNLPPEIHRRLKTKAAENHRSMTKQAIDILEQGTFPSSQVRKVKPFKGRFLLTEEFVNSAKREGLS
jgi:plasmid stability protein